MYAYAEQITDWFIHGYHIDEICLKLRLCPATFFEDPPNVDQ